MPRCAGPTQHGSAVCGTLAFSSAALRPRLDVRLPLPLRLCRLLKRVVRVTPPASLFFALAPRAPAQPGPTGPAVRCALLRVSGVAGPDPTQGPGPAFLQGSAPGEPAYAGHWVPALPGPWDALRPNGSAASLAASPQRLRRILDPTSSRTQAVCTGDARFKFSQRDRRRSARCMPWSIGFAAAVGLCSVSRRRPSIPPSFRRSPLRPGLRPGLRLRKGRLARLGIYYVSSNHMAQKKKWCGSDLSPIFNRPSRKVVSDGNVLLQCLPSGSMSSMRL